MKIRVLSDIHLEFASWYPPEVEADVTVLAGDIQTKGRGIEWAKIFFPETPVIPDLSEDPDQIGNLGSRQREIESWLAENDMADHHWIALDDMPELFVDYATLSPNIYIVAAKFGLREQDVEGISAMIERLKSS